MVAIIAGLLSAGCSVFGIRNEQTPSYSVERTVGPTDYRVEVRQYGPRLVAETTVAGSEFEARSKGFRTLAGYIFGGNSASQSIAMTAPVAQSKARSGQTIDMTAPVGQSRGADGRWTIRFFMPDKYTIDTIPKPNDPAVQLRTVPAQIIAVHRYSGSTSAASVHEEEQRLMAVAAQAGLQTESEPFTWFYDPPWTLPPLRRNEAAVLVQPG
ncbi:MAG: heme-binding protein [Acetobacteraceae bacterium]|nr:heme-binding protein [Acetobacteraceae bacterium]